MSFMNMLFQLSSICLYYLTVLYVHPLTLEPVLSLSLSISVSGNEFFGLTSLINIIPLWCDKTPQMHSTTLICISFYFHSVNCDDSTFSFHN